MIYFIIMLCGIWSIYNYATFFYDIPYLRIAENSIFFQALSVIVLKWSLVLGVLYIVFAVVGFVLSRKEDNALDKVRVAMLVVGLVTSACMIL